METVGEAVSSARPVFSKPQPPRKLTPREKTSAAVTTAAESASPAVANSGEGVTGTSGEDTPTTTRPPQKPLPQKKPRTTVRETSPAPPLTEVASPEATPTPGEGKPRPSTAPTPPQKPKPPKVKQRPSQSTPSGTESEPVEQAPPTPEPQATPTKKLPTPAARPVPVPRKRTSSAVRLEESKQISEEVVTPAAAEKEESTVPSEQLKGEEEKEESPLPPSPAVMEQADRGKTSPTHSSEGGGGSSRGSSRTPAGEERDGAESAHSDTPPVPPLKPRPSRAMLQPTPSTESSEEGAKEREAEERGGGDTGVYEDMDPPLNSIKTANSESEMYELMDYDSQGAESGGGRGEGAEHSDKGTQRDKKKGTSSVKSAMQKQPSMDDYELMNIGEGEETDHDEEDGHDYEQTNSWIASPTSSRHSSTSVGFVPTSALAPPGPDSPPASSSPRGNGIYDVPRPVYVNGVSPSTVPGGDPESSGGPGTDLRPPQSPDVGGRSHSLSSSGSVSSAHSENLSIQAKKGSKVRTSLSSSSSLGVVGDGEQNRRPGERLNSREVRGEREGGREQLYVWLVL